MQHLQVGIQLRSCHLDSDRLWWLCAATSRSRPRRARSNAPCAPNHPKGSEPAIHAFCHPALKSCLCLFSDLRRTKCTCKADFYRSKQSESLLYARAPIAPAQWPRLNSAVFPLLMLTQVPAVPGPDQVSRRPREQRGGLGAFHALRYALLAPSGVAALLIARQLGPAPLFSAASQLWIFLCCVVDSGCTRA